jgi:hypothetical protein
VPNSVAYTAVLDVKRSTAEHLARLLRDHRIAAGTRKGRRALGCFRQGVLVLRWFLDGTRLAQLACDNGLSVSTSYRYLHEGLAVLAAGAPDLTTALERAKAAGLTHLNLDGTVIRTDRVAAPGPNGADLWWSGKHQHHGGNIQVIATPDGWPILGLASTAGPGTRHHLRPPPRAARSAQPCRPWSTSATKTPATAFATPSRSPPEAS